MFQKAQKLYVGAVALCCVVGGCAIEPVPLHGVDVRVAERPASKGETLHYVETATVADWATARDLCATLKSFGQNCIPATR